MRACDNPFNVDCVSAIRYRPFGTTFEEIFGQLDAMDYRAAIVGLEGTGKTTLLEDLQPALERRGRRTRMVFVNDTSPLDRRACHQLLSRLASDEVVLLDGADAIGYTMWLSLKRRILSHAAGLVITTHCLGRLPTLIHCTTTPELLADIVADLLPQHPDDEALHQLYHHHQGNIRNCLRDLYDRCACDRVL
jgi:hypothetical protein